MIRIFTSYFGAVDRIMKQNPELCFISISRYPPAWWLDIKGLQYKNLAPTTEMLNKIHQNGQSGDHREYIQEFNLILSTLDRQTVVEELTRLSNGRDVCLLCFENPQKFCHRHLVAFWLNEWMPDTHKVIEWDDFHQQQTENSLF